MFTFQSTFSFKPLVFFLDVLVLHGKLVKLGLFLVFGVVLNSEKHFTCFVHAVRGGNVIIVIYFVTMEDEDATSCHHMSFQVN